MPVHGNLAGMPLPELLQWIGGSGKSGCLQIDHDKVTTSLFFERGRLIACSSDDPPKLLGQFLLFRGVISEEDLRQAMSEQEVNGQVLGKILVDNGIMTEAQVGEEVARKAKETVFGLFDWEEGCFIFIENASARRGATPLSMETQELLLAGMERLDDRARIRRVIPDRMVIPRRTSRPFRDDTAVEWSTRQIYQAVNGERTVEDVMLRVHGSEFPVIESLFQLYEDGYMALSQAGEERETGEKRETEEENHAEEDPDPAAEGGPARNHDAEGGTSEEADWSVLGRAWRESSKATASPAGAETSPSPPANAVRRNESRTGPQAEPERELSHWLFAPELASPLPVATASAEEDEIDAEDWPSRHATGQILPEAPGVAAAQSAIEMARRLIEGGEFESALEALAGARKSTPTDATLRRLNYEAERGLIRRLSREEISPTKVPIVLRCPADLTGCSFSPMEEFLLGVIDGIWDVRSLTWIAPMRVVDVLCGLKRLVEQGVVELREPGEIASRRPDAASGKSLEERRCSATRA